MFAFSLFLILIASMYCVAEGVSFYYWLAGATAYGVFAYLSFDWSLSGLILYLLCLAGGLAIYIERSWMQVVSQLFFKKLANFIPKLSETEEEALKFGDAWLEKMVFTGDIDWKQLEISNTTLTPEEQQFLDEETQELCQMLDEWTIAKRKDLSPEAWQFIKDNGFLGMVIAKEYGGKGFSARLHSDVIVKIASRSSVAAVTVMVPNSLGPGELLMHYGTEEQKQYYLPRLAKGIDIPCFALTEPEAGSDATSIQSEAIVCMGEYQGKKTLGLRMNLDKRWITLAPIASLIGVAVNLKDPDNLLQGEGKEGITCILMHRDTPHLIIGPRHIPANQPFMNGIVRGKNLFVPISFIIGGQAQAGNGWHMLVECLSVGRAISLPAMATASSTVAYLAAGAFCRLRRQFNTEILSFEGIQEKLASIAGLQYLVQVCRLMTLAAVDQDKKPAVASVIAKYFNTELGRQVVVDAMDIHGGRTVVEGPRNYLMNHYQGIPISVTVEGANIMSRNLLIFGQGSMVCHPFIQKEFFAIRDQNQQAFNDVFWGHAAYSISRFCKSFLATWSKGLLFVTTAQPKLLKPHHFLRLSYNFAFLADIALITLGGQLKRKERLSARLADAFSFLYMALAIFADLKRQSKMDELMQYQALWSMQYCYAKAQAAMLAFIREYPNRLVRLLLRLVIAPFGQSFHLPCDSLEKKLSYTMSNASHYRESLLDAIYLSGDPHQPLDRVEQAFEQMCALGHIYEKIPEIRKVKFIHLTEFLDTCVNEGKLTEAEKASILNAETARYDALLVDEFVLKDEKLPSYIEV